MRVPRIYTPQALAVADTLELESAASKHLLTVLRLKAGASLVLFDGSGREFDARLAAVMGRRAQATVTAEHTAHSESPLTVTLVQGISRGERMDYSLQKAVELGVSAIVPVIAERSVVRLDGAGAARKLAHWQQLIISACEQSGRVRLPPVTAPLPLGQYLAQEPSGDTKLLLDPDSPVSFTALAQPPAGSILLLVGPEGGWSDPERHAARTAGFQGIRLGPRILRTETASVVALSLLQGLWGDLAHR